MKNPRKILHKKGLNRKLQVDMLKTANHVFTNGKLKTHPRCTFFAYYGIDTLISEIKTKPNFSNPRIEGCDHNPFNQHYWLALDINKKPIIIDPIFGYMGLEEFAKEKLDKTHLRYYKEKRIVPTKDNIRIKTISL